MCSYFGWIPIVLLWIQTARSMSLMKQQSQQNQHSYFMDSEADNDVAEFIVSKGYLPSEKELPKSSIVKNVDNDVTYLLSKLSDEELIKLLNDQPKKSVYDINDIVKVAVDAKSLTENNKVLLNVEEPKPRDSYYSSSSSYKGNKRFQTVNDRGQEKHEAFFRLDDKPVEPYGSKSDIDPNYTALQKINNLLYSRPQEEPTSDEEDERKELLFDVLVAQLKTLCCKKSKSHKSREFKKLSYKPVLNEIVPQSAFYPKAYGSELKQPQSNIAANEYMFLIINDEIKGNGSDELISVDPESLEKNSSVLLLGPITTPLTNGQLKAVMSRISKELSKADYLPLLQQISDGTLSGSNIRLMKSLVTGPETRRYIKPHRCNHQSPLAKVYGGPKWIICTGYLNLNTPSLYD